MTTLTLKGYESSNPSLYKKLREEVVVTPIEQFLAKAFGESCTWQASKETVFDSIGRDYQVLYTPGINFWFDNEWDRGVSHLHISPKLSAGDTANPHAVGNKISALEVLSVYSDEPDWLLDDDVPRLAGKGLSKKSEGTATRVLRHFWYRGENHFGVDFDTDQEIDSRMQLYYELSLVAFQLDEPYWGYRFLAIALHYLQDLTQPFHTLGVISSNIVDNLDLFHAWLCDKSHGDSCKPEDMLDKKLIKNSWIVGAYHALFEDFALGMYSGKAERYSAYTSLVDPSGYAAKYEGVEALNWQNGGPLLDAHTVLLSEQEKIVDGAEALGDATFEAFGFKYKYNFDELKKFLSDLGKVESIGFQMATAGFYLDLGTTPRQDRAIPGMVDQTRKLFERTGIWGREFIKRGLEGVKYTDEIRKLRAKYQVKCARDPKMNKKPGEKPKPVLY